MHIIGEKLEADVDTGASASVVAKDLVRKLGIWKIVKKVKVKERDGSFLGGNFVVHTCFKVIDFSSVLGRFVIDSEVLEIGNMSVILAVFRLLEKEFVVDTQHRWLKNISSGQAFPCSV